MEIEFDEIMGSKFAEVVLKNQYEHSKERSGFHRCYSDDTEILSENGWKLFKDLQPNEKVATRNKDGYLEYQLPTEYISMDYKGKMYLYNPKKAKLNFMVTPNHNMFIKSQSGKNLYKEKIEYLSKSYRFKIPRTINWVGQEQEYIEFKINNHNTNNPKILKIKMDNFLAFFGMWIAEGTLALSGYRVMFVERKERQKEIELIMDNLGFHYLEEPTIGWNGIRYVICCKNLYDWFKSLHKSENKYIPRFILNLSSRQLKIFFDWYMSGDGTFYKNFEKTDTVSTKLADDLQEIALKIGIWGNKSCYHYKSNQCIIMNKIVNRLPNFRVCFSHKKTTSINAKKIKIVDYNGKVYCVTIPNGIIYVRRNGKPMWCGNSDIITCEIDPFNRVALGLEAIFPPETMGIFLVGELAHLLLHKNFTAQEYEIMVANIVSMHIDAIASTDDFQNLIGLEDWDKGEKRPIESKTTRKKIESQEDIPNDWIEQLSFGMSFLGGNIGYIMVVNIVNFKINIIKIKMSQEERDIYKKVLETKISRIMNAVLTKDSSKLEVKRYSCKYCQYRPMKNRVGPACEKYNPFPEKERVSKQ